MNITYQGFEILLPIASYALNPAFVKLFLPLSEISFDATKSGTFTIKKPKLGEFYDKRFQYVSPIFDYRFHPTIDVTTSGEILLTCHLQSFHHFVNR